MCLLRKRKEGSFGVDNYGVKNCYDCCGILDKLELENLEIGGKMCLYLVEENQEFEVTNWPGTLTIPVFPRIGNHNFAGKRYDVWFNLGDKKFWGVRYGDDTDIVHVKRVKDSRLGEFLKLVLTSTF